MKRCPECRRDYTDETLNFCVDDGTALLEGPASGRSGAARTESFFEKPATVAYPGISGSGGRPSAPICPEVNDNDESTIYSEPYALNDLGAELSPLIGRDSDLREILDLLEHPDIRLITITGIGGTGKTRLAQCVAHNAARLFPDGVYFVGLSAIETIGLVLPIIAQTLGVREEAGRSLQVSMREHLRDKKLLIILDNFEQITGAATQVGELLSGSLNAKIIVTSRVRLHLRFEHEYPLQPLALPAESEITVSELAENPAIALFVDRARSVKHGFALTKNNAQLIASICRRLDGLPLAIELAAVRIKLLAPQAILTRLSSSLKLLTGGARDLPERQQTIRGTIQWSYDLLDAEEQRLLCRLAVFAGGFTLDSAEAVANADGDLNVDLLDGVASLVDKSLLVQREMPDGEPRFRMLEVVREFALEALDAGDDAIEFKRLHAQFYARLAETAEPELFGPKTMQWIERLQQEHNNLRSAIEWSLAEQPETALRIAGSIYRFWSGTGNLMEGVKWIKQSLESIGQKCDRKLQAKGLSILGDLIFRQGRVSEAKGYSQKGLLLARETEDKSLICRSLSILGIVTMNQGDLIHARGLIEESLAIAKQLDGEARISTRLNVLGEIARQQGDYQAARRFYEDALTVAEQESAKTDISIITLNLASVECLQANYKGAVSFALEGLNICQALQDEVFTQVAIGVIASLAVSSGKPTDAARLYGKAQAVFDKLEIKLEKSDQIFVDHYIAMARVTMGDEEFDKAFQEGRSIHLEKAIALAREIGEQIAN